MVPFQCLFAVVLAADECLDCKHLTHELIRARQEMQPQGTTICHFYRWFPKISRSNFDGLIDLRYPDSNIWMRCFDLFHKGFRVHQG